MRYLITFILLFVCSIVEASPAPNWVLGRGHSLYDPDQYLIGVGVSEADYVSASESARAELIKSIRVKVNSTLKDYRSTEKSFSYASTMSQTDFLLEGSQVKDGWYDEDKNVFYSLVVIKRQYILDTLLELINNIVSKNALTLRQGDSFSANGHIVKALVYYYDGYVESSKLLPYIQTYKSVIMDAKQSKLQDNYNLVFQEKIQDIVEHIELEKINHTITDKDIKFNVRVKYKDRGLNNFPIKFYSIHKHYVERTICESSGCSTKTSVVKVLNKNNDIFMKAVVDMQTLGKYFTYDLSQKLFGRLERLSVSFKDTLQNYQKVQREKHYRYLNKELDKRQSVQRKADIIGNELVGCNPVCPGPYISNNVGNWKPNPRVRGDINFNIGFGNGRNRGFININPRW